MGGCQSSDARNAAIDANFPADSRHVMMSVKSDKELNKMQDGTKTSQPDFKPRAGYQPRSGYQPRAAYQPPAAAAGTSARTMTNSDEKETTTTTATAKAERRATDTTALDLSTSSKE